MYNQPEIIRIFYAYQFTNAAIPRTEREASVVDAIRTLSNDLVQNGKSITLDWSFCDLASGISVKHQIDELISDSDIFIADITEANKNVYFELGFAFGLASERDIVVQITAAQVEGAQQVASDLSGLFIERYEPRYFRQSFGKVVSAGLNMLLEKRAETRRQSSVAHQFWGLNAKTGIDLICSEIPTEFLPSFAFPEDRDYVRYVKFADLDALVRVRCSLARSYPDLDVRDFVASEHTGGADTDVISIGGPAWNTLAASLQSILPVQIVEAENDGDDDYAVVTLEAFNGQRIWKGRDLKGNASLEDVSVVACLTNPVGRRIFLFMGALTKGVLGGAMAFIDKGIGIRNTLFIQSLVGHRDYLVLFRSLYIGTKVTPTLLEQSSEFEVFCSDPGINKWDQVVRESQ